MWVAKYRQRYSLQSVLAKLAVVHLTIALTVLDNRSRKKGSSLGEVILGFVLVIVSLVHFISKMDRTVFSLFVLLAS